MTMMKSTMYDEEDTKKRSIVPNLTPSFGMPIFADLRLLGCCVHSLRMLGLC